MGDTLTASVGSEVEFSVHVAGVDGAKLVFLEDGQPMAELSTQAIHGQDQTIRTQWKSDVKAALVSLRCAWAGWQVVADGESHLYELVATGQKEAAR